MDYWAYHLGDGMVKNTTLKALGFGVPAIVLGFATLREINIEKVKREGKPLSADEIKLWMEGGIPWTIQAVATTAIMYVNWRRAL
jgi:UDP:flavonoid glycosyltransferase YjiC (YdhE family)